MWALKPARLIINNLTNKVFELGITKNVEFRQILEEELLSHLMPPTALNLDAHHPAVILLVGVNGPEKPPQPPNSDSSTRKRVKKCYSPRQTHSGQLPLISSRSGQTGSTCRSSPVNPKATRARWHTMPFKLPLPAEWILSLLIPPGGCTPVTT